MPEGMYGMIANGSLLLNSKQKEGYKPVRYESIPNFDQTKYYIIQKDPVENEEHIFVGIEMRELPEDLNEGEMMNEYVF